MVENWKTYKISEVASVQTGPFGSQLHKKDYVEIGTPIITVEHLGENRITYQNLPRVSKEDKERLSKYHLKTGDVVFSRVGSVDRRAYVTDKEDGWLFSGRCLRVRADESLASGSFLSYYFGQNSFKNYIRQIAVGATMPSINTSILSNIEVSIPPLKEQKAIAAILSILDDKIELNLQMNKTLEAMAMVLYKHWFVDFGPFQDGEFVDSELGKIPVGWEVKRLDEFLEIKRGGSPRPIKEFIAKEGLHWLKISDATKSNSPFLYSTKEFIKKEGLRKTILIKPGNIILSNSATPGLPRLIEFETCIHDGWLHFPKIDRLNRYILYLLFLDIKKHLIQQGNGSVFTNLKTDILKAQLFNLPPIEIENKFSNQITPWFEQIRANTEENQTLTKLRDTLLPKLISGEARVKEAAKKIAKAL